MIFFLCFDSFGNNYLFGGKTLAIQMAESDALPSVDQRFIKSNGKFSIAYFELKELKPSQQFIVGRYQNKKMIWVLLLLYGFLTYQGKQIWDLMVSVDFSLNCGALDNSATGTPSCPVCLPALSSNSGINVTILQSRPGFPQVK